MRTRESAALRWAKWTIAVISAVIGGLFGVFGGPLGVTAGGVSGFFFGYFFIPLLLSLKNEYALAVIFARVIAGTTYGTVAGIISGAAVYLPAFVFELSVPFLGDPAKAMGDGAVIGAVVGAPFGFLLSSTLSLLIWVTAADRPEEPDSGPNGG